MITPSPTTDVRPPLTANQRLALQTALTELLNADAAHKRLANDLLHAKNRADDTQKRAMKLMHTLGLRTALMGEQQFTLATGIGANKEAYPISITVTASPFVVLESPK